MAKITKVKTGRTPYQAVNPIYGGDFPQVNPQDPSITPAYNAQVAHRSKGLKGAFKKGTAASVGGTSAQTH
jgi:hypothetical protein